MGREERCNKLLVLLGSRCLSIVITCCPCCPYAAVPVEASLSEDRPEDYIADVVKQYLAYFRAMVAQKNMAAILQLYDFESVVVRETVKPRRE